MYGYIFRRIQNKINRWIPSKILIILGESRAELQGNHATSSLRPRSSQKLYSYLNGRTSVVLSFLNSAFNALLLVSIIVSSLFAPLFLNYICPLGRNQVLTYTLILLLCDINFNFHREGSN